LLLLTNSFEKYHATNFQFIFIKLNKRKE